MKKPLLCLMLLLTALVTAAPSWAGSSCNGLLNLGFYNVSQKSPDDAQALGKSTFCAYDYKRADLSVKQQSGIEAAYGLFSMGAGSGGAADIIELQSTICASGFGGVTYSNKASAFAKRVYQGALDAWNKCQALSVKGLIFEVDPSSTLQGVTVNITAPQGLPALYAGVSQYGAGRSDCTTTNNGSLVTVKPGSPFRFTSTSNVTVNCERQLVAAGDDLTADAQDLVFTTSVGNLNVPLAAIGSLSRVSADQLNADMKTAINQSLVSPMDSINSLVARVNSNETNINYLKSGVNYVLGGGDSCPAGYTNLGRIGFLMDKVNYANNPFSVGGDHDRDWKWTHPRLCRRNF